MSQSEINSMKQPTLLVMAGGTGGHIFPGLAVADELKAQGWNIHWLGTADKMEAKIVPEHGFDISFLNISGLRNKGMMSLLTMPFKLLQSLLQARQVFKKIKPDVVLGMGGYASAPGGLSAWLGNIPLIIHEQNAAAGLSNRLLAKFADKVCCAFPNAFSENIKAEVVGNPLRATIGSEQLKSEEREQTSKNILVVGGSLGAQVLNKTVPESYKQLLKADDGFCIWHQTGAGNQTQVISAYSDNDIATEKVKVTEFISDMAAAYHWADVVICRAGALTVSELAMAATPAIFVPLPHAVDDDQTKNALYLVEQGAAKLLPQAQLSKESISLLITELFKGEQVLKDMAKAALAAANGDASQKVAKLCQQLVSAETVNRK